MTRFMITELSTVGFFTSNVLEPSVLFDGANDLSFLGGESKIITRSQSAQLPPFADVTFVNNKSEDKKYCLLIKENLFRLVCNPPTDWMDFSNLSTEFYNNVNEFITFSEEKVEYSRFGLVAKIFIETNSPEEKLAENLLKIEDSKDIKEPSIQFNRTSFENGKFLNTHHNLVCSKISSRTSNENFLGISATLDINNQPLRELLDSSFIASLFEKGNTIFSVKYLSQLFPSIPF